MMRLIGLITFSVACSSNETASMVSSSDGSMGADEADYANDTQSDPSFGDEDAGEMEENHDDGLGSEQESDFMSLMPATTNAYVFVANPDRNTVSRINVDTLDVLTVGVGVEPTLALTSSDFKTAVTFDKGSDSISIIDADSMDVLSVSIRNNLNQMKMSPDGNWVVCYYNIELGDETSGGAVTTNAISIVNLETGSRQDAIVGAHPHDVQFTADSSMSVVISDDYLAAIDLSSPNLDLNRIAIAEDLVNPPKAEEVLLDPMGRYAIVRQYAVDELVLVDFINASTSMLTVGSNPTDMDVSSDGSQAIVVARGANEVWVYDLDDPTLPAVVTPLPANESFGSLQLTADDGVGILYSTQSLDPRIGIWNRDDDEISVHGLVKPISQVGLSPTGETAILFHPQDQGNDDTSSPYYFKHALTLMDMDSRFSSVYQLSAKPKAFSSTPDGRVGFYIMEDRPYLEVLDYQTFVPTEVQLPSNPIFLGTLPETNTAFVSQEHELGRISFFNSDEQNLQTITGFELNAAIEHE